MTSFDAFRHIVQSISAVYELQEAASIAAILLEDVFHIKPKNIGDKIPLSPKQQQQLEAIVGRLRANEPVQYIIGYTYFYGLKLKVDNRVLIPRQETEELVAWVLEAARQSPVRSPAVWQSGSPQAPSTKPQTLQVLDIGTGSGCIPIAIKKKRPEWVVYALDVSAGAMEVAKENANTNEMEVHFHQVDILDDSQWEALPMFDIIVSNPPYITKEEKETLPKNVVDYEPHLALFAGGNDAQRFVKKIADFALLHLHSGGSLFFETNEFYAGDTKKILEEKGYLDVELKKDLNGKDRMIKGVKP